jgi:uncharacterized membrane protein YfcA
VAYQNEKKFTTQSRTKVNPGDNNSHYDVRNIRAHGRCNGHRCFRSGDPGNSWLWLLPHVDVIISALHYNSRCCWSTPTPHNWPQHIALVTTVAAFRSTRFATSRSDGTHWGHFWSLGHYSVAVTCHVNALLGAFLLLYVTNTCREDHAKRQLATSTKSRLRTNPKWRALLYYPTLIRQEDKETVKDDDKPSLPRSAPSLIALPAGFIGGCLAAAFGTAGPAILVFAREAGWESQPEKFRTNLQVIFFALNVHAIMSQTISRIINMQTLRVSVLLVPALVLGGYMGGKLASKVCKDVFRVLVLGGITVMGIMFVSKKAF